MYINYIINGLCQGSIYALIAIGYTLIFGVTGLVTFCFGEVVMFGGFAGYYIFQLMGTNVPVAALGAFLLASLVGVFVHKLCYERFLTAPRHISLLCTIGMSTLLRNAAQLLFGTATKSMPTILAGQNIHIFGVRVSMLQLLIMGIVVFLSIFLSLFLNKTKIGAMLRCVKQDRTAAALMGIDASRITMIGNCIGSALGGVAGLLYCISYTSVYPTLGVSIGRIGFSAAVLGGMVSIPWAAAGGIIIGVLENLSIAWMPASLRTGVAYVFLIIVLIFLPQGVNSKGRRDKL